MSNPFANSAVLDAALSKISTATKEVICSSLPTTVAEANSYALLTITITSADFTIGNGDVSGRKVTLAAKTQQTIATGGLPDCLVVHDGSSILYAWPISNPQTLTSGAPVNVSAVSAEIRAPQITV
jgi:pyrrolidone-carboxylate peptidase